MLEQQGYPRGVGYKSIVEYCYVNCRETKTLTKKGFCIFFEIILTMEQKIVFQYNTETKFYD